MAEVFTADELQCDLAADVIRRFGVLRLRVNGYSMLPSIWPGDVVSVSGAEWGAYRPRDVVMAQQGLSYTLAMAGCSYTGWWRWGAKPR